MKILHTLESYLPSRHGMQEVVSQLSEFLVKLGHDVTIATSFDIKRESNFINGVKIRDFKISGNLATGIIGDQNAYLTFLKSEQFDIITNFAAQQWATDLMLPILSELNAKKVFVPTGFSALYNSGYSEYFSRMKTWIKGYDASVFLSNDYRDINFFKENGINGLRLIPNGASETEFKNVQYFDIRRLLNVSEKAKLILTVGSHTGYKGHSEAIKIFEAAKVEDSVLLVIGNVTSSGGRWIRFAKGILNLFNLKRTNCSLKCCVSSKTFNLLNQNRSIHVRTLSRELTLNAYKQADVFLFPSLIECSPIVLFEAMAAKTPFLVSDVGNSREILAWSDGGEILPTSFDSDGFSVVDIDLSAKQLKSLIDDEHKLKSLASNANKAFMDNFTWEKIAYRYEELYNELLNDE